ncbi:unnamed protein product [Parajaminaea phylloscopi]
MLPAKRKMSPAEESGDEELDASPPPPLTKGRGGSELVPSTKPGEPPVTKRTLQNRKAQREFRKRREARVKELEERCRRFDQMGLEANGELQRVARRFKDENEALRGLLIRLGHGGLIQSALEGLSHDGFAAGYEPSRQMQMAPQPMPPQDTSSQLSDLQPPPGSVNPNMLDPMRYSSASHQGHQHHPASLAHPHQQSHPQSHPHNPHGHSQPLHQQQQQQQHSHTNQPHPHSHPHPHPHPQQQQQQPQGPPHNQRQLSGEHNGTNAGHWAEEQQQQQQEWSQPRRERSGSGRHNEDKGGLLSLKLGSEQDGSRTAAPSGRTPGLTPGTFNHLMGMLTGQHSQQPQASVGPHGQEEGLPGVPNATDPFARAPAHQEGGGAAGGGSAFIKREPHGTPFAHRPHQNDALLNPNPIPFALNLSNEPLPDQSWWDRNGGGMFGGDSFLDEKAQAVAQAQAHSPFDLGSFLNTGATPGIGGYNSGMPTGFTPALAAGFDALGEAGADMKSGLSGDGGGGQESGSAAGGSGSSGKGGSGKKNGKSNAFSGSTLGPAEHIQTFLRLLERQAIKAKQLQQSAQTQTQAQGEGQNRRPSNWTDGGSDVTSSSSSGGSSDEMGAQGSGGAGAGGSYRPSSSSGSRSKEELITPMAAYSRLAQHPAFMKTDAKELEEIVSTIHQASIATTHSQGSANAAPLELRAGTLRDMLQVLDRKHAASLGQQRWLDAL